MSSTTMNDRAGCSSTKTTQKKLCRWSLLISVDAKALEWNVAVYLSQDPVGLQEIRDGVDAHNVNQSEFGLPDRLIAKRYLFRQIFGGSAWSYANDPDFMLVSDDMDFWQSVIDRSYKKYSRLFIGWHDELIANLGKTDGIYESLSGRYYKFERHTNRDGGLEWPKTQVFNYPVQGLAADIIMLARISLRNRMRAKGYKSLLINTIHDSIQVDAIPEEWYNICMELKSVFEDLPKNFERMFGVEYNLPLRCEITLEDGTEWQP
jgi:DNA polymerase-1